MCSFYNACQKVTVANYIDFTFKQNGKYFAHKSFTFSLQKNILDYDRPRSTSLLCLSQSEQRSNEFVKGVKKPLIV